MQLTVIQEIVIWALPVLFAITLHEVAHGWVAKQLGDPTAQMLGRITLNPIKHIDPVGTVLVPLLLLVLPGNFLFGWAKPVPITPQNLRNPRRDMAIVALAGPTANFIMALLWAIIARAAVWLDEPFLTNPLVLMGFAGIAINLVLMILNLIPLPPLDGGRIVSNLLPPRTSAKYDLVEPYGFMILVLLLMTGILGGLLSPFFNFFQSLLLSLVGLR
ncbi:MAG: site-2 protease family protein [Gammaproteobacteria bacterium]|nr:site-2 protease family protein [Gammaproteobacteria bacterium]